MNNTQRHFQLQHSLNSLQTMTSHQRQPAAVPHNSMMTEHVGHHQPPPSHPHVNGLHDNDLQVSSLSLSLLTPLCIFTLHYCTAGTCGPSTRACFNPYSSLNHMTYTSSHMIYTSSHMTT